MASKKFSSKKHKELNAGSHCEKCKLYFYNKYQNLHSKLFKNYYLNKIEKDNQEISCLYCYEKGHSEKLKYY